MRAPCALLLLATSMAASRPSMSQSFEQVSTGAIAETASAAFSASFIDADADGRLDLFVNTCCGYNSQLFLNTGNWRFVRVQDDPLVTTPINGAKDTWMDLDEDGDLDLLIANLGYGNHAFANDGRGHFTRYDAGDLTSVGSDFRYLSPGDVDGDGHIDVVAARRSGNPTLVFRNVGGGRYSSISVPPLTDDATDLAGAEWIDQDSDGDMDVVLTGYDGESSRVFRNDRGGVFLRMTETLLAANGSPAGPTCWGDFDGDGDMDTFARDGDFTYRQLRNDGGWTFQVVAEFDGVGTTSCRSVDVENDGDLDVFLTTLNGKPNRLYLNDGSGQFELADDGPVTQYTGYSSQSIWGDLDRDGDLDVFIPTSGLEPGLLYRNIASGNHWLHLDMKDAASGSPPIGALVEVVHMLRGKRVRQIRDVVHPYSRNAGGYELAFGLGDAELVDSLIVHWPSGVTHEYVDIEADRLLTLKEQALQIVHEPIRWIQAGDAPTIVVELLGDMANMQSVSVMLRLVGGQAFEEFVATETDPGRYSVQLPQLLDDHEYYLVIRSSDLTYTAGNPDRPFVIRVITAEPAPRIESVVDVPDDGGRHVTVSWHASTLDLLSGGISHYGIWRFVPDISNAWDLVAEQPALMQEVYSRTVQTLFDSTTTIDGSHLFKVVAYTSDPVVFFESDPMSGFSVKDVNVTRENDVEPGDFRLGENYPNPFNPTTIIPFALPVTSRVRIVVYDVLGREIERLVDSVLPRGNHETTFDAGDLPSGLYLYRLEAAGQVRTGKMTLQR